MIKATYGIGALSTPLPAFYARLGRERWHGPSWVIGDDGPVRTADEDDGLLALRCAASTDVDLTSSIACHDRRADAW